MKKREQLLQLQINEAMTELETLNFSDLNAILTWLEKVQKPSNDIDIVIPHEEIIRAFLDQGFDPFYLLAKNHDRGDEESSGLWLIGNAIDCLKKPPVHAIPEIFGDHVQKWRERFGYSK